MNNGERLFFGWTLGGVSALLSLMIFVMIFGMSESLAVPVAMLIVWPVVGLFGFANAKQISDWIDRT